MQRKQILIGSTLIIVAAIVVVISLFVLSRKAEPLHLDGVDIPESSARTEIRTEIASIKGFCDNLAGLDAEAFATTVSASKTLDSQTIAKLRQSRGAVARPGQLGDKDSWLRFFRLLQEECR